MTIPTQDPHREVQGGVDLAREMCQEVLCSPLPQLWTRERDFPVSENVRSLSRGEYISPEKGPEEQRCASNHAVGV